MRRIMTKPTPCRTIGTLLQPSLFVMTDPFFDSDAPRATQTQSHVDNVSGENWTQMNLALPSAHSIDFKAFLGTRHDELLHTLNQADAPLLYIWGARGTGKRHLLRLWFERAQQQGKTGIAINASHQRLPEAYTGIECLAIGNVEHLNAQDQEILFNFFNHIRQTGQGALFVTSELPPARLPLREDVCSRMGFCLTYRLENLSDEEKIAALNDVARKLQLHIRTEHFHWLMQHWRRDTSSLLALLYQLDQHAVERQHSLTLPFIKAFLEQHHQQEQT